MARLRLSEIAAGTGGTLLRGDPSLVFERFGFDSRQTQAGELFFALIGERDGHDYVKHAAERGAKGAVTAHDVSVPDKNFAIIRVSDTLTALHLLAKSVLEREKVRVVGITGSAGKTTTKDFTASFLSPGFRVLKSPKSFNNQIGLPMTLLELEDKHDIVVLEMGMNHPGEIKTLTGIAPPDVAVITNINPVHLEFFDDLEGIALAKKEILDGTKPHGTAVLNGDDAQIKKIASGWKGKKVFFSFDGEGRVRVQNVQKSIFESSTMELVYGTKRRRMTLPLFYESHLKNFLAAAAAAYTLAVPLDDIQNQAQLLKPVDMRGTLHRIGKTIVVDESYNSNPVALSTILDDLSRVSSRRKVAVLGDMLELGDREDEFHRDAGLTVARLGWDVLITVGPAARRMAEAALQAGMDVDRVHSFRDSDEASGRILPLLNGGDLILVKGSRGTRTEKIVAKIKSEGI